MSVDELSDHNVLHKILSFSRYISQYEDINTVLDVTLENIRDLTDADAGTFYLLEGEGLRFAYVQNDTLFSKDSSNKQLYTNSLLPINDGSIAGYVALTKKILNIHDVAELPAELPFKFNRSYDEASGYRTVSMLVLPMLGVGNKLVAVLQLINSKDENGAIQPFSQAAQDSAEIFASQALPALARAIGTLRLISRMNDMATLHDPTETGGHVLRVGAYSAEIYTAWARMNGVPEETARAERDSIRLAAMLHDVGKIAVPDKVLKKPGKVTDEEFAIIKRHCAQGASVYGEAETPIEKMAFDITLNHHQNWNGTGYTGDPKYPVLKGEEIPIYARIVSVADVFDALVSPRCYKEPWPVDKAFEEIERCSGSKFDPAVVKAALSIRETIMAIKERFPIIIEDQEAVSA